MYSFPININELPSRKLIIQTIAHRILNNSPVAIIGESRSAKTNLLEHLSSPQNVLTLYGGKSDKLIFNIIDCQMKHNNVTEALFWEKAISPIAEKINEYPDSVARSYTTCQEARFHPFALEKFFAQLEGNGKTLIVMLDEFSSLIGSELDKLSFWGAFRGLMSRTNGLIYIIASRYDLYYLTEKIQGNLNRVGSPIFNYFMQVRLQDITPEEAATLLGNNFSPPDKKYILSVAGGNLYLLQLVADKMQEQYSRSSVSRYERHIAVGNQILDLTKLHFSDLWGGWSSDIRKALTTIALLQAPHMLQNSEFQSGDLQKNLTKYEPEVRYLHDIGLILKIESIPGGYSIRQGAMLWWLADEISRITRDKVDFEEWLMDREIVNGIMSRKNIRDLKDAAKYIGTVLDKGVTSLIDAYAKGLIN